MSIKLGCNIKLHYIIRCENLLRVAKTAEVLVLLHRKFFSILEIILKTSSAEQIGDHWRTQASRGAISRI